VVRGSNVESSILISNPAVAFFFFVREIKWPQAEGAHGWLGVAAADVAVEIIKKN
jgi:hypothetical protein